MDYIELVEKYKNYSIKELKETLAKLNEKIKKANKEEKNIRLNEGLYTEAYKKEQYNKYANLINEYYIARDIMFEKEEDNE